MHNVNIEFVLSLFILGAAVLAFIHHTALYYFGRDRFLLHYLLYLFCMGIFLYAKTGLYAYFFGKPAQTEMLEIYREALQIVYLTSYFNFIIHAIGLSGEKKPFLFRYWPATATLLLLYAVGYSLGKIYFPLADYAIPFVAARLFIFAITGIMLYQSYRLREIRFQQIILYGCTVYMVCGIVSFVSNLYSQEDWLIYPLEWLMIGSFIDIIFFSFAIGYRTKKIEESLNLSLLEEANKVIEKQAELENERDRIAADMHDDLGSGLTRITYLSQMALRGETETHLEKIRQTSGELVRNMGELIWVMKEENNTLEDLVSYIRAFAADYFEANGIALQFRIGDFPRGIAVGSSERRHIFLSVKESCHNIIKHAQATQTRIRIDYRNGLEINISDNGKGLGTHPKTTGNGLKNMAARMEKIGGSMTITNENGLEICFALPLA